MLQILQLHQRSCQKGKLLAIFIGCYSGLSFCVAVCVTWRYRCTQHCISGTEKKLLDSVMRNGQDCSEKVSEIGTKIGALGKLLVFFDWLSLSNFPAGQLRLRLMTRVDP